MASFLDLPDELVREIFEFAAMNDPPRPREPDAEDVEDQSLDQRPLNYTLGWILLTHVHRSLRITGLDMAHLWASVVTVIPYPAAINEFLCRARHCKFTLHVYDQPTFFDYQWVAGIDTLEWATFYQHRVSAVYCHSPHYMNSGSGKLRNWIESTHLPCVQQIMIAPDACMTRGTETLVAFDLNAPQVKSVVYWNAIHSHRFPMHTLRTLNLTLSPSICVEDTALLVDALRVAPTLHELILRIECNIPVSPHNDLPFPDFPPLKLSYLKIFDVATKDECLAYGLWESVRALNVQRALIHCDRPNLVQKLSEPSIQQLLSRASYTHLILDARQLALSVPNADGPHEPSIAAQLLQLLGRSDMDINTYGELLDALRAHAATSLARVYSVKLILPPGIRTSSGGTGQASKASLIEAVDKFRLALDKDAAITVE